MVKPLDLMAIREKLEKALMHLQRASSVLLVARHQSEITSVDYDILIQDIINLEVSIKTLLGDE